MDSPVQYLGNFILPPIAPFFPTPFICIQLCTKLSTLYMCGENGFVKFQGEGVIARVGGWWWWCVSENFLNITGEPESLWKRRNNLRENELRIMEKTDLKFQGEGGWVGMGVDRWGGMRGCWENFWEIFGKFPGDYRVGGLVIESGIVKIRGKLKFLQSACREIIQRSWYA